MPKQGETVDRLRAIPLFAELSEESLGRILETATEIEVEAGYVLVEPKMPGSGLFVIQEGTAEVELPSKHIEYGPGDFFGELALLDASPTRTARVRAKTPLRAVAIGRSDFLRLLEAEPKMAISMLRALARRLIEQRPA